jgi:hypothetical protein
MDITTAAMIVAQAALPRWVAPSAVTSGATHAGWLRLDSWAGQRLNRIAYRDWGPLRVAASMQAIIAG